jgi:hypothetical protein
MTSVSNRSVHGFAAIAYACSEAFLHSQSAFVAGVSIQLGCHYLAAARLIVTS